MTDFPRKNQPNNLLSSMLFKHAIGYYRRRNVVWVGISEVADGWIMTDSRENGLGPTKHSWKGIEEALYCGEKFITPCSVSMIPTPLLSYPKTIEVKSCLLLLYRHEISRDHISDMRNGCISILFLVLDHPTPGSQFSYLTLPWGLVIWLTNNISVSPVLHI